ncbi:MAG: hypothetical protein HY869_17455 [Chloroflexi bacterium]|nr:hypothetical protein [Chloroflexota bacterium]
MNKLEAISTRLELKEIETLKKYYEMAKNTNSQHFSWEKIDEALRLDYPVLKSLAALGYVHLEMEKNSRGTIYDSYYLTLYPSAIHRAEFEDYNKYKQRLVKNFLNYRDWIAVSGFTISVVLAIIKVIEFLNQ